MQRRMMEAYGKYKNRESNRNKDLNLSEKVQQQQGYKEKSGQFGILKQVHIPPETSHKHCNITYHPQRTIHSHR